MLFNSYVFMLAFLPATFSGFLLTARIGPVWAAAWLGAASLFFYGWWDVRFLPLLLGSIVLNYMFGRLIAGAAGSPRRWLAAVAVAGNLAVLAFFKYADFFLASINAAAGADLPLLRLVLPIGISFFTFTQIAFLADTFQGKASEPRFVHYLLFVTYFPHLIAGPVLHHKEMMPQFANPAIYRFNADTMNAGLTLFVLGLCKKVLLADNVAVYATPVFDAAAAGAPLSLFEAWGGALAYTMQLYFDFSGYSDMAIGLSLMFGVRLPLNFNSPYKATSIIDFWRRWHMTLSRFLRDYLYIPFGGNRRGPLRRHLNLLATMLLGRLWHGAGWTFVVWGGLHGAYLIVNHLWRAARTRFGIGRSQPTAVGQMLGGAATFIAVVVAWVFFRSADLESALRLLKCMSGLESGLVLPERLGGMLPAGALAALGIRFGNVGDLFVWPAQPLLIGALMLLCWLSPNTQEVARLGRPVLDRAEREMPAWQAWLVWRPTRAWSWAIGAALIAATMSLTQVSEFLYFQF